MVLETFLDELRALGDKERIAGDKRYHKSKREHLGLTAPKCDEWIRSRCKGLSDKELLEISKELWETDIFDLMIAATKILSLPRLKPSPAVWDLTLYFLTSIDGWALQDTLAIAARRCILANESLLDTLEEWTKDQDFWMRRAALVYTLPYAKAPHNPERMLTWAASYAKESEWFIQKAIGWWLRVLGEHNPERVTLFLQAHYKDLKGVAKREASRKLSPEWQNRILQIEKSHA
ncbi:MAG: DNA alkylation repair protein [Verrucomicrobia bacterium]|nr:DNA alkylation repair protein [Verrucomicrobiota bacterium]